MWISFWLLFIFNISIEHVGNILPARAVATTTPNNVPQQAPGTTAPIRRRPGIGIPVDPWEQYYRRFHQYDVNNFTSFTEGLVSLQKLYCPLANLCGNSTEYRGSNRCISWFTCQDCECDPACTEYGDCCPDTIPRYGIPDSGDLFRCIDLNLKQIVQQDRDLSKMIATCPVGHRNLDITRKCEHRTIVDDILNPPVTDKANMNTYRNMHCAQCRGVEKYELWASQLECYKDADLYSFETFEEYIHALIVHPNCSLFYEKPFGVTVRNCVAGVIKRCNVTGKWQTYNSFLDMSCKKYTAIVHHGYQPYNNIFCYMCNGIMPLTGLPLCFRGVIALTTSLSALLKFDDAIASPRTTETAACGRNELHDTSLDACRNITCPLGKERQGGTCVPYMESVKGGNYRFMMGFRPQGGGVNISNDDAVPNGTLDAIMSRYPQIAFESILHIKVYCVRLYIMEGITNGPTIAGFYRNLTKFTVLLDVKVVRANITRTEMDNRFVAMLGQSWTVDIEGRSITFVPTRDPDALDMITPLLSGNVLHRCITHETSGIPMVVDVPGQMKITELLTCWQVELHYHEYALSNLNNELLVKHLNVTIDAYSFNIAKSGTARLCLDFYKGIANISTQPDAYPNYVVPMNDNIEGWLSLICTCISLFCLLCMFATYALFSSLRSRPGINNMFLTLTLFLAQGLFQFGVGYSEFFWFCRVVGVLIHYAWLSAFCWMHVCSYHMYKSFANTITTVTSDKTGRLIGGYCSYAFGIPAIIVFITIGSHVAVYGPSNIGYGGALCYLNSGMARGLAFGLPLAVIIASNMAFFAATMRSIRNTPEVQSTATRRHHVLVYIKLSTLTGLAWVFGFAAAFTGLPPLSYVFVVLVGSQGALLFMSYVCNARVAKLYRGLFVGHEANDVRKHDQLRRFKTSSMRSVE